MSKYSVSWYKNTEKLTMRVMLYQYGGLAIEMICDDGDPFGMLTVNLGPVLTKNAAFIDDFVKPIAEQLFDKYGIGYFTTVKRRSGFNTYRLAIFDEDFLTENSFDSSYEEYLRMYEQDSSQRVA